MQLDMERLRSQLILEEGLRLLAYDDATGMPPGNHAAPRGNLTVGVGHNLDARPLSGQQESVIGHNGRIEPITHGQVIMLLNSDIAEACRDLNNNLPWWEFLDEIRARVLVDLCFNMGIARLLLFRNFLAAMRAGAYDTAANELEDSMWYGQVGCRGVRLVAMVRTGEDYKA